MYHVNTYDPIIHLILEYDLEDLIPLDSEHGKFPTRQDVRAIPLVIDPSYEFLMAY